MRERLCTFAAAALAVLATAAAAETIRITVDKLAFTPAGASAHVGDIIEWVNGDFLAHTATARGKEWDIMILPNKSGRVTLKRAGKIDYYCRFHPNMTGRLAVTD